MKKLLTIVGLLATLLLQSQGYRISGKVVDDADGTPVTGAAVRLILKSDSTKARGTITDANGNFELDMVRKGSYVVNISFLGYSPLLQSLEMQNEPQYLGTFKMKVNARQLRDVEVTETQVRMEQKGDTTEFNAAAFKTNPDATAEDLVKKMPGITSDNGVIKSNGEELRKVTVDGKNFFGDDAQLALKNLPSDAVDRVQVFDALSDQGAFSSFDDGNSQKQMNIVTKKGMNNGVFGKVYAGYGYLTDSRYNAGATLNWFKGNRRLSFLGMSNNVNEQNFSIQDLIGATGGGAGGAMRMMNAGGGGRDMSRMMQNSSMGNFYVGNSGGISTTHAAGLNFTDVWGKHVRFTGSYFFNLSDNVNDKTLTRQYFNSGEDATLYAEKSSTTSRNMNHRVNMKVEYYIDSMNTLIVTPKFSIQQSRQQNEIGAQNTLGGNSVLSTSQSDYAAKNIGYNATTDVFYSHKFRKPWRTISANFNAAINNKNGSSNQESVNVFAADADSLLLDQQYEAANRSYTLSGNVSYTEPVTENGILLFTYTPSFNRNFSDKETYNRDWATDTYTLRDTGLSNQFENDYMTHKAGVNFKWKEKKAVFTLGVNLQYAQLKGSQVFPFPFQVNQSFIDMLPTASFQYNFSERSRLRLNYRTSTNAPSIQQLQSVVDNSNPLLLSTGNPDLKQSFTHNVFFRYNINNMKTQHNFFMFSFTNIQTNYIANATVIAASDSLVNGVLMRAGSQLTSPVNLSGYVTSNLFMNYSLPLKRIKCNLSLNAGLGYNRTPGLINEQKNITNNVTPNMGITLSSNISEKIDFSLSYNGTYTVVKNSLRTNADNNFFNHFANAKVNWMFWKGFVFNTSVSNTFYAGLGDGFNQNIFLWNAALGYKFLKDKSLDIRFSVNDILNQNNGISRTVNENFLEDTRTVVLKRYCLLTITYNLKFFNKN